MIWINSTNAKVVSIPLFNLIFEPWSIFFIFYFFANTLCLIYIFWFILRNRNKLLKSLKTNYKGLVTAITDCIKSHGIFILFQPALYVVSAVCFCLCDSVLDDSGFGNSRVVASVTYGDTLWIRNLETDWDLHYSFNRCCNPDLTFRVEPPYLCPPRIEVEVQTVTVKTVSYMVFDKDTGIFVLKAAPQLESPVQPLIKSSLVPNDKITVLYPTADPVDGYSFSRTRYEGEGKQIDPLDDSCDTSSSWKRKRSSSMDISRSIKN